MEADLSSFKTNLAAASSSNMSQTTTALSEAEVLEHLERLAAL